MIRKATLIVCGLLVACQSEPEPPASDADSPPLVAAPTNEPISPTSAQPDAPQRLEPSTIHAPVWTAPTPTRTRLPVDETLQDREIEAMHNRMIAAEACPLVDAWFAPCEPADALLAALEPIGNGSPGASERDSRFAANHINDPAAPARLFASWLLANHPKIVVNYSGEPDLATLVAALEQEDHAEVLAFQLRLLASRGELASDLAERTQAVATHALGHPLASPRLAAIELLVHPDVRAKPGSLDAVWRAAGLDADADVRASACRSLGAFGNARVEAWLLEQVSAPDSAHAAACLEGAVELAALAPTSASERLLDAIAAVAAPTPRTLRLLARVSGLPRERVITTLLDQLLEAVADSRVRDSAAFALVGIGAGAQVRTKLAGRTPDVYAERLLDRVELLATGSLGPDDLALALVHGKLAGRMSNGLGAIATASTWNFIGSDEDAGAAWDALSDAYFVVLTPRDDFDQQQVRPEVHDSRAFMLPPHLITMVADAASSGRKLPKLAYPAIDDDEAWSRMFSPTRLFDELADGYTIGWGFMSEATQTRRPMPARANLIDLATSYQALRAAAPAGAEAVITAGVAAVIESDRAFFGPRRRHVALSATTRETFAWCWQDFAQPCEELGDPSLVDRIERSILGARLADGDIGIRVYDIARRERREELVELLRVLTPLAAIHRSRIFVELTGPFVYAGLRGDPSPWLGLLDDALAAAGVDRGWLRFVVTGPRKDPQRPRRLERLDRREVWLTEGD